MKEMTLSRREREKLWQRQQMLNAAVELFSRKGYHHVTMHEIAQKAEFAIGTLYKFFRNKEDLYKALMMEASGRFHEALSEAVTEPEDLIDKLRNYVKIKGIVFQEHAAIIRLYFAESRGASFSIKSGLDRVLRDRYTRFLERIAEIFECGMRQERFRRIADPYMLAVVLDNACNAFLSLWLESPERHPYPEDPDVILNILFQALVNE